MVESISIHRKYLGTEGGIVTLPPSFKTQSPTKLQETLNMMAQIPRKKRGILNMPYCGWDKVLMGAGCESPRWPP